MGFLEELKKGTQDFQEQLAVQLRKFKSKEFANGTMAICALVAGADGEIDENERAKTVEFITSNETLSVFDAAELKTIFENCCDKVSVDTMSGEIELFQSILEMRGNPEQSSASIRLAILIGASDGDFDDNEKAMVRKICGTLDLEPDDFGL